MSMRATDHILEKVDVIELGMPSDNLAVDERGDIYAAAFPNIPQMITNLKNPLNADPPGTIWRIRKVEGGGEVGRKGGYEMKKVLEDKEGRAVSGMTTAEHDVCTGRIFMGGESSLPQNDFQKGEHYSYTNAGCLSRCSRPIHHHL